MATGPSRRATSPKYAGYLFTYFTALSQGNDPTRWRQLNGGRPVPTSTVWDQVQRTGSESIVV